MYMSALFHKGLSFVVLFFVFCCGSLHMRKLLENSFFHFTEPRLGSFMNKDDDDGVATLSAVLVRTERICGSNHCIKLRFLIL